MMTHKIFVKKMLKQSAVQAEYDSQAEEFAWLDELLKARRRTEVEVSHANSRTAAQADPADTD
jgi:hypothetical protein